VQAALYTYQIQTLEYILFQVIERARNDLFKPARTIVNDVMAKCAPELSAAPAGSRPNPDCLKRTTNRKKGTRKEKRRKFGAVIFTGRRPFGEKHKILA